MTKEDYPNFVRVGAHTVTGEEKGGEEMKMERKREGQREGKKETTCRQEPNN